MEKLEAKIKLPSMDAGIVSTEIGNFIVENVLTSSATGGVIGLSGGVDSTTTAALAKMAFEKHNSSSERPFEIVGYILPSSTNNPKDTSDGVMVAGRLGMRYEVIMIEPVIEAFKLCNPEAFANSYDKGNLVSRIRANILSTKAATEKKIVLGTGNKDEDFGIGYYTLFGDGAVHCSPIGNLPKRLVREMAVYLGFPDLAERVPTAGLEPGQTDFGDLGYNYDTVELVLEGIHQGFNYKQIGSSSQVIEMIKPQLEGNPKFKIVKEIVNDILRRHYEIAIPKSKIIHPPAANITLQYR